MNGFRRNLENVWNDFFEFCKSISKNVFEGL